MEPAERDLERLERCVRALAAREPHLADFFAGADELVLARAPGRLDVMGGIADYSGSLVLELPLEEATCVAAARTLDDSVWVASLGKVTREARFPAHELWAACHGFDSLRGHFEHQNREVAWAAYALGGLVALRERGAVLTGGLRVLVDSAVPEGKGVSSSAALEVAALAALAELWRVPFSGRELGLACQQIENRVVGAPCGVMDQMTSACGQAGRLLALLCQPAELRGFVTLPDGVSLFGIDSGARHEVVGADYRQVRVAAFMGLRILAEQLGARVRPSGDGKVVLADDPLDGYLAKLPPDKLTSGLLNALPERVAGAEFLARFSGISDLLTGVEPSAEYMVRAATLHPIYEHARVEEFARSLPTATAAAELVRLGGFMFASHASYSACGLGSDATDELVAALRSMGPEFGCFGAKISGGGSGGTVAVLARTDTLPRLRSLAVDYSARTGRASRVFAGSSSGSAAVPARRITL